MRSFTVFVYIASGLISFFWSMSVIVEQIGFIGGLLAFFFFPVTIVFAPIYVGFQTGDWTLAGIAYGGGFLASIIYSLSADDTNNESSLTKTSETTMPEKSVNQKNAVETDYPISNTSPSSDETSTDTDQSSIAPVWILLLAVFIVWKSSQTNLEYAIGYCVAYYVVGICVTGVVWLFWFRTKSSWTLTAWLNNGAYGMIAFLFLSFVVRTSVENTMEEAEQRESSISQQTTSNHTRNLPIPQSPHIYSDNVPQDDQLSETNVPFAPTNQQLSSIQRMLSDLGFRPGPIDGVVGPRTREAIRAFENRHGWPETGEPSQRLLEFAESRSDRRSTSYGYNSPECILKPVMTDDDYRACGLNPPSTY